MSIENIPQVDCEAFTHEHVEALRRQQKVVGSPKKFVGFLTRKYATHDVYRTVVLPLAAHSLPHPMRSNEDRYSVSAFYKGILVGVESANLLSGEALLGKIARLGVHISVPNDIVHDPQAKAVATSEAIYEQGIRGYQRAENFHPLIETWEEDVARSHYYYSFRCGFGFIMDAVDSSTYDQQRSAMVAASTGEYDFDDEMKRILAGEI